jgi:DNA replicative helicase MCM subunit Mcm2 (Cdc46/Mcm family)
MTTPTLSNLNQTTITCKNCEITYHVKWDEEETEPTTCPFCGADTSIEEEDAIFENEEEQDDWN